MQTNAKKTASVINIAGITAVIVVTVTDTEKTTKKIDTVKKTVWLRIPISKRKTT